MAERRIHRAANKTKMYPKGNMKDISAENDISGELVQEELKALVEYIERHVRWSKSQENPGVARLNMIAAESLIEAAQFVRTLCEKLSA